MLLNCTYCGKKISYTDRYCPNCGSFNEQYSESKLDDFSLKERTTAGILGIFLGFIGIHNFYLKQKNKGLIKLILSLIGIIAFFISLAIMFSATIIDPVTNEVVIVNQSLAVISSLFMIPFFFLFIPMIIWGLFEAFYILISKNAIDGEGLKLK